MKLIYFDGLYARAESTAMMLAHARVQYENERLGFEEFGKRKAAGEYPNGQLPVWVQNGRYMNESLAIIRLVGKQFGYYPPEFDEAAQADALLDFVNEHLPQLVTIVFMEKKYDAEGLGRYKTILEKLITFLEKRLAHGHDFLVGNKLTIADFETASVVFSHIYNPNYIAGASFTDAGKKIVAANPRFAAYVERLRV